MPSSLAHVNIVLAMAVSLTFAAPQNRGDGRRKIASVRIIAVDAFGSSLGDVHVLHFVDDSKHDLASKFSGPNGIAIPYGSYWLHVETEKQGPIRDQILVARSDTLLVLVSSGLVAEYSPAAAPVLAGQVLETPDILGPLWVKLCGIYSSGCKLAEVDNSKQFTLINPAPGTYMITLLAPSKVLMLERVDIESSRGNLILRPGAVDNRVSIIPSK